MRARVAPRRSTSKHPKLFALTAAARPTQTLTAHHPASRQGRVDQVVLATATITTPRPITLIHEHAVTDQKPHQAGAVAPAPLDPKRRLAKAPRPAKQLW